MPSRHRSRQRALQVLYQADVAKHSVDQAIEALYGSLFSAISKQTPEPDEFMEDLARGTAARMEELDSLIARQSAHWRIERMSIVDRNILRLALYEMKYSSMHAAVVIDEALELARRFSGDESVSFVNGVLDALRKEQAADG